MNWIDPWISKEGLKWYLLKHIERDELDNLLQDYVTAILKQRIIIRPSRGCREDSKDFVACENEETKVYCSYVIKRGHLKGNLDGKWGILNELDEALSKELPGREYWRKPRTAVVAHNGYEGNRNAYRKYETYRQLLENKVVEFLLRPVERWDVEILTDKLFPHGETLKKMEMTRKILERHSEIQNVALEFYEKFTMSVDNEEQDSTESHGLIKAYCQKMDQINSNYSSEFYKKLKDVNDEAKSN